MHVSNRDLKTTFSSSKNVVSGAKLMDWMIQSEMIQSREEGMALAKDLFGIKILRHSKGLCVYCVYCYNNILMNC